MAEAFGIVSGTVGLTSIFSASLDCFRYIQLGRHFEQDYQQNLVTLKLLESRLSRWGAAVRVYDEDPQLGEVAEDTMFQILRLFSESERKSQKFSESEQKSPKLSSSKATSYTTADVNDPDYSALVKTTDLITSKRKKRPGILKLASWVIYERNNLKELSEGISTLMDSLEDLFPVKTRERLAEQEIAELGKSVQLEVVQKITEGIDELLQLKAKDAVAQRSGHTFGTISVTEDGQASNGDVYLNPQTWSGSETSQGNHVFNRVEVSGRGKAHNGNWYGGSPFHSPA